QITRTMMLTPGQDARELATPLAAPPARASAPTPTPPRSSERCRSGRGWPANYEGTGGAQGRSLGHSGPSRYLTYRARSRDSDAEERSQAGGGGEAGESRGLP